MATVVPVIELRLPARPALLTATVAALGLALAGCGGGAQPAATIPQKTVQSKVRQLMKAKTGKDYSVTCPGDLTVRAGETMRCYQSDRKGNTLGLTVGIKNADAADPTLTVKADPRTTPKATPKAA